jgi:hypothetical protein
MSKVNRWLCWQDGVELIAFTKPGLESPNVIVHCGRMVNTPVGNAAAGIVLWQPDPEAMPAVLGFVCPDKDVGKYFGPNIFGGSAFEHIPVLHGSINVMMDRNRALLTCIVGGYHFEVESSDFSPPYIIHREPSLMPPFWQQGVEMSCGKTILRVNGEVINLIIPPVGISGGPASVVAPNGIWAR